MLVPIRFLRVVGAAVEISCYVATARQHARPGRNREGIKIKAGRSGNAGIGRGILRHLRAEAIDN